MSCSWVTCCTIAIQPSKSVSRDNTNAPLAMGWMSWALETLSFGRNTTQGMLAAAQYAASEAEVSPVEAQATALIGVPLAIICLTTETRTVMPRSLNDPVWLLPHCFTQRSLRPIWRPRRSAQNRFVPPSYMEMTFFGSMVGQTHSILPQMAL